MRRAVPPLRQSRTRTSIYNLLPRRGSSSDGMHSVALAARVKQRSGPRLFFFEGSNFNDGTTHTARDLPLRAAGSHHWTMTRIQVGTRGTGSLIASQHRDPGHCTWPGMTLAVTGRQPRRPDPEIPDAPVCIGVESPDPGNRDFGNPEVYPRFRPNRDFRFPDFPISRFPDFPISRFPDFPISRFPDFPIPSQIRN
jgi:hypothetical protein